MNLQKEFMVILNAVKRLVIYAAALAAELAATKVELAIALQLPVASAEEIRLAQEAVIKAQEKAAALQLMVDEDVSEDAEVLASIEAAIGAPPIE